MNRYILNDLIYLLLIALFIYTAVSKVYELETFHQQMLNQPLPHWLTIRLSWMIPSIEIIAVVLLAIERVRVYGFILSFVLLGAFTLYVLLILVHFFDRVPCSCGGVLQSMTWEAHLAFNIIFLCLAFAGLRLEQMHLRKSPDEISS
jgi:putative oxidoreductase